MAIPIGDGAFHLLTNEGLKAGDKVFPMVHGYRSKGRFYAIEIYPNLARMTDPHMLRACTGWPDEPHTIKSFFEEDGLRCIHTDKGYSPAEVYFKLVGEAGGIPKAGPCSECVFDSECKLKHTRKGGCLFYSKSKEAQ